MKAKNTHWTSNKIEDFQYSIAADFVMQIEKKMNAADKPITNKEMAKRLGVSPGRVSQVLNDPSNLELKTIIRYSRALGMKVAVVAYDDNDQQNENGPINSEVFQICWTRQGSPRNYFELQAGSQLTETARIPGPIDYRPAGGYSRNRLGEPAGLFLHLDWPQKAMTP